MIESRYGGMADAQDSKSCVRKGVGVQVPLPVLHSDGEAEKALMLAVLEDAIYVYLKTKHQETNIARREFAKERVWFDSEDDSWYFSFEHICDVLKINAHRLRRRLRKAKAPSRIHVRMHQKGKLYTRELLNG